MSASAAISAMDASFSVSGQTFKKQTLQDRMSAVNIPLVKSEDDGGVQKFDSSSPEGIAAKIIAAAQKATG